MVAQNFRRGAGLAYDFVRSDCTSGILADVLGYGHEQLRFPDHTGGKRSARDFHWALPDRSSSDVSRRRDFDFVRTAGAGVVLGAARLCASHSSDCSAALERGENSSSGVARLFRILSEHTVPAYPAGLVSATSNGSLLV